MAVYTNGVWRLTADEMSKLIEAEQASRTKLLKLELIVRHVEGSRLGDSMRTIRIRERRGYLRLRDLLLNKPKTGNNGSGEL